LFLAGASIRRPLECGEHRRFGCFLASLSPSPWQRKTKAAMLAALQSTAGSQAVPSIIQPIEKVSLARRPLR
jgi:hypothetical protein